MTTDEDIRTLITQLDAPNWGEVEDVRERLVPLGDAVLTHFVTAYPTLRTWKARVAVVYTAVKFARRSALAQQLGRMALTDKSTHVRYRACMLVAYALDREALPELRALLTHKDVKTVEDARAAIDAIEHRNHHLFQDRNHTGRVFWTVSGAD